MEVLLLVMRHCRHLTLFQLIPRWRGRIFRKVAGLVVNNILPLDLFVIQYRNNVEDANTIKKSLVCCHISLLLLNIYHWFLSKFSFKSLKVKNGSAIVLYEVFCPSFIVIIWFDTHFVIEIIHLIMIECTDISVCICRLCFGISISHGLPQ